MFKRHPYLLFTSLLVIALFIVLASVALAQGTWTAQTTNAPTLGQILADSNGKTLYMFQNDKPGVSNCNGNCAQIWPPATLSAGMTPTLASGVSGTLTTLKRQDGTTQVQFNDMPLYYYAQDAAAGDTKGQGVGGVWWVINPASGPVKTTAQQATAVPGATAAGAAAAATPAVPKPNALPTTGTEDTISWLLPALAAAVLMLVAGLAMIGARRAR